MTEKTEGVLNALTIVGLVLVSFVSVVCVALCIMLAAGYFNKEYEPLEGLKFSTTEPLVISENAGSVYLTVLANTALVTEDGYIQDNTVDSDIKITVYVGEGKNAVKDTSIIEVPSTVKKGVPFKITAKTLEDGFNKGGVCYIDAQTSDTLYRVAKRIPVYVDVPVDHIEIVAHDTKNNSTIDLSTTKFIYEDTAQISVEVFPERSYYIYGDTSRTKNIIYISSNPQSAAIGKDSGLMEITYNTPYTESEEPLEEPLADGYVTITARINKFSTNTEESQVSASAELKLFPLQLGQIIIKNESYKEDGATFSATLFRDDRVLKVSAEETGLPDVINLQVLLQPTIVKDENYSPLKDLSGFQVNYSVENSTVQNCEPVEIIPRMVSYDGHNVYYWEIVPQRLIENGEQVFITMNLLGYSDTFEIRRELKVEKVDVSQNSFTYLNKDGNEFAGNAIRLSATKYDDNENDNTYENMQIYYTYSASDGTSPSFGKIVNFVTNTSTNTDSEININEVGSQIIVASKDINLITDELESSTLGYKGYRVEARGAGIVNVAPYLVRTNADGEPVDKDYNVITTDPNLWGQAVDPNNLDGAIYVQPTGLCKYDSASVNAQTGQYIWYQTFRNLSVTVSEVLTRLDLYKDSVDDNAIIPDTIEGTQEAYVLKMGTQVANKITIYAKPNSVLAIPASSSDFNSGRYDYANIQVVEVLEQGQTQISDSIFDLPSNIMTLASTYFNTTQEEDIDGTIETKYQRWIKFDLSAKKPADMRTIRLNWGGNATSLTLNVVDVKVDSITAVPATNQFNKNNGEINYWQLYPNIEPGTVLYNNNYYNRLSYVDGAYTQNLGYLVVPSAECDISQTDKDAGLKAPSYQEYTRKLYLLETKEYEIEWTDESNQPQTSKFGNIDILIANALSTNTNPLLAQAIWKEIAEITYNSEHYGTYKVSDYAETKTVYIANEPQLVLNIKKALPSGYALMLFFIPKADEQKTIAFTEVHPDVVRVNYVWPTLTAQLEPVESMPQEAIAGNNSYYIYYEDESQRQREFNLESLYEVMATYYANTGEQYATSVRASYTANVSSTSPLGSKEDNDNSQFIVSLTRGEQVQDEEELITYTLTIDRTIYFVTDCALANIDTGNGEITWNTLVQYSKDNGGIQSGVDANDTDKLFLDLDKTTISLNESVYFIIKNTAVSEGGEVVGA